MFWDKKKPEKKKRKKRRRGSRRRKRDPSISRLEKLVVEEIEVSGVGLPLEQQPRPHRGTTTRLSRQVPGLKISFASVGFWLILCLASLFLRNAWPTDETRQLAVAWEMWVHGDILLPYLNGELYTRDPPLLFWLIHVGWKLWGVSEWWPRLVPALFALFSLMLVGGIARNLWPGQPNIVRYAPLVLVGMPAWAFYSTLALPDLVLASFTLLAMLALLLMWRQQRAWNWMVLGLALGFGSLAGGFVIFLFVMPAAVLAAFWVDGDPPVDAGRWYGNVFKGLLVAAAVFGAWLWPIMDRYGVGLGLDMLARYVQPHAMDLFPQHHPWWWYLLLVPLVLIPWSIWPLPWMRLWSIRRAPVNSGFRFCMVWMVPAIIALTFTPSRQPQFLLPLVPALSLLMTYLLLDDGLADYGQDRAFASMSFPVIILGGLLALLPGLPQLGFLPALLWELPPLVGVGIAFAGIILAWFPLSRIKRRVMSIAVTNVMLVVFAVFALAWQYNSWFEMHSIARILAKAQDQERPIAHVGPYQGQFHFAGRLFYPLAVVSEEGVAAWAAGNRDGLIVTYEDGWQPYTGGRDQPIFEAAHRGSKILVWKAWFVNG